MPNQPEEWYFDDKYWLPSVGTDHEDLTEPNLPAIIAEADRRATLRTWEEAKQIASEESGKCCGCERDFLRIEYRINSRIQQYGKENNT